MNGEVKFTQYQHSISWYEIGKMRVGGSILRPLHNLATAIPTFSILPAEHVSRFNMIIRSQETTYNYPQQFATELASTAYAGVPLSWVEILQICF